MCQNYQMRAMFEAHRLVDGGAADGSGSHGWPWSTPGSWQHDVEAHLEPWLRLHVAIGGNVRPPSAHRARAERAPGT